jgi:hypothetical protein
MGIPLRSGYLLRKFGYRRAFDTDDLNGFSSLMSRDQHGFTAAGMQIDLDRGYVSQYPRARVAAGRHVLTFGACE